MIEFSTFDNKFSKIGKVCKFPFSTFAEGMTSYIGTMANKGDLPLWSPTIFTNGRRGKVHAEKITCLVYDMDDGIAPFDSWRLFSDYNVIAHTSFSHKPQFHKYRIILPLANPIPACEWNRASIAGVNLWNETVKRGAPDGKAIVDNARMYFRFALPVSDLSTSHPLHPAHNHEFGYWESGAFLDLKYDHIKIAKPVMPQNAIYTPKKGGVVGKRDLMLMPDARLSVANSVGAEINGNVARKITCSKCNRRSVHFYIDLVGSGIAMRGWQCNHKGSCGNYGFLEELL